MNRRNFLKSFSLSSLGLAAAPELTIWAERAVAPEDFSLNLITDDSERAILLLESLLARFLSAYKNLKYSERVLTGSHRADLLLIKNRRVLDYRNSEDELAKGLCEAAKNLGLPKTVKNPILMQFYTEDRRLTPKIIHIFGNNILIKKLSLTEDEGTHQIESETGRVTLIIRNKSAQITAATCKHKTCMNMGAINAAGQSLICLPNHLRISFAGQNEPDLDGVTF
jgi:hypothetical protein